jgi:hypothetical protein
MKNDFWNFTFFKINGNILSDQNLLLKINLMLSETDISTKMKLKIDIMLNLKQYYNPVSGFYNSYDNVFIEELKFPIDEYFDVYKDEKLMRKLKLDKIIAG